MNYTDKYVYGENVENEYPDVQISIERISPEVAACMLEKNTHNRAIGRQPLDYAMLTGQWVLNGDAIVFSEEGVLLNGQHRLTALVKTNTSADFIVARGIKREAQVTMDVGKKRTLADYLKMDGFSDYTKVAAVTAALMRVDAFGLDSHFSHRSTCDWKVTLLEQYRFATTEYERRIKPILRDSIAVAQEYKLRIGLVAPLFEAFREVDENDFAEFASQLRGLSTQCQPVQKLVKVLNENKVNDKSISYRTLAAYFIKAWNAYMRGEDIPWLRFRTGGATPESFPVIYKPDYEMRD